MSTRRVLAVIAVIALAVSVLFVILHLMAAPDDALITPLEHAVAALGNFSGPWGVAIVRLVDFPNAGLRSFSWTLAVGLTVLGALLLVLALKIKGRPWQILVPQLGQVARDRGHLRPDERGQLADAPFAPGQLIEHEQASRMGERLEHLGLGLELRDGRFVCQAGRKLAKSRSMSGVFSSHGDLPRTFGPVKPRSRAAEMGDWQN